MDNYLFLYLKTGGGHLAPAKAVAKKITETARHRVNIELVDGLAEANPIIRNSIEDGYKNSVNHARWFYAGLYAAHKNPLVARVSAAIVSRFVSPYLERQIIEKKPAKIVIFHFFLVEPVFGILERNGLSIPVLTVVTDPFTAHPIWFLRPGQNYVVFSQELRRECLARGIPGEKLQVFPFALDEKFSRQLTDVEKVGTRLQLGFDLGRKIILIMGGGDGMPRGAEILRNVAARNLDAQVAIVCGKNRKLLAEATRIKQRHGLENLKVYGYVDFVHSLIGISDVVITKCGASTFMEILMMGKVLIINNYIWEQEKGNMEFVCSSGMGVYEESPARLPELLGELFADNSMLDSLRDNIRNASLLNGTAQVSEYILNFN